MARRGWARGAFIAVLLLGVGGSLIWRFQDELLLAAVGFAADRRTPVGPPREIDWSRGSDPLGRTADERPPNIVLILADDLGWNDLRLDDAEDPAFRSGVADGRVPTPALESLAREGVRFTQGYAANGTCAPSRAAILSGRYGTRFGFEFTPTPPGMSAVLPRIANRMPDRLRPVRVTESTSELDYDELGMPASEITLAELLQQADYHTVHIGKWHLGRAPGMAPQDQGFDESLLMASGLYLPPDHAEVVNSRQPFDPIDRFLWRALKYAASFNGSDAFEPEGYLTDYYSDQAVRVIEANADRPFFLYLAHWAPHTPLQALRADYEALAHIEDHRLRVYAAMIRALDRGVGRVLDALKEQGIDDDTLVLFTSDNGAPGYLGLPDLNRPYRGWKITFFEGGIRVPFLARWPGHLPAGARYDTPVHGFDLYSTAAAAAGVEPPEDRVIDGVDLLPFARGERSGAPHPALFWRSGHYRVALADGWKLQTNEGVPGSPWLFDLRNDPTEQTNLAEREPGRLAAMRRLLAAHETEQAPPRWPSRVAVPVNVDKTLAAPDAASDEYIYWPN